MTDDSDMRKRMDFYSYRLIQNLSRVYNNNRLIVIVCLVRTTLLFSSEENNTQHKLTKYQYHPSSYLAIIPCKQQELNNIIPEIRHL